MDDENEQWKLSQYELQRKPHLVITDDTMITVKPKEFQSDFTCPICLDIMKTTMTTKECLHRFCQECITTALRNGNKECPTCRKKLVSRRSLRADPMFDALIQIIFPKRDEHEAEERAMFERIRQRHKASMEKTKQIRSEMRKKKQATKRDKNDGASLGVDDNLSETSSEKNAFGHDEGTDVPQRKPSHHKTPKRLKIKTDSHMENLFDDTASEAPSSTAEEFSEVELVLSEVTSTEISQQQSVGDRYLKTSENATIAHLAKYLEMRAAISSKADSDLGQTQSYAFTASLTDSSQPIEASLTLSDLVKEHGQPLQLYYKMQEKLVSWRLICRVGGIFAVRRCLARTSQYSLGAGNAAAAPPTAPVLPGTSHSNDTTATDTTVATADREESKEEGTEEVMVNPPPPAGCC